MARDFDGAGDHINFASDASIDNFASLSVACWVQRDVRNVAYTLIAKDRSLIGWNMFVRNDAGGNALRFDYDWSTTDGNWTGGAVLTGMQHVAVTYSNSSTANDPVLYVDGVAVSVTESSTPAGSANPDAGQSLYAGETGAGGADLDGRLLCISYDNTIWTAEMVNRHRWWGMAPGGPSTVKVWHPLFTDSLTNKGTATANGTATGTTMASLPRVMRPGCGGW